MKRAKVCYIFAGCIYFTFSTLQYLVIWTQCNVWAENSGWDILVDLPAAPTWRIPFLQGRLSSELAEENS